MATLYEMKEKMATVGAQLKSIEEKLVEKLANPSVPMEEVNALKKEKEDLQARFDLLKEAHDKLEKEQQAALRNQNPTFSADSDKEKLIKAKAAFIRAAILKQPVPQDALEVLAAGAPLQAIPAGDGTGGENLLPTNMSNELISEPFVDNPLRGVIGMSNIKGLELPKITFELDGDGAFIADANTAAEINATGDKVTFARNKFKVKVRISDTVLHGSDVELVSYVENALRSGLAAKEKACSFADHDGSNTTNYMTFYAEDGSEETLIKSVEGADLFDAITNAIADLHETYRENAKVVMRYADYVTILKTLANGATPLYGAQPEQIIGKPVIFSDAAEVPIVGDFRYYHLNYDGQPIFDSDKDVDKGEYIWVLTAWFDQRIKLYSAFRLAEVVAVSG